MKFFLLVVSAFLLSSFTFGQIILSPSWSTIQNSNFPILTAGVRYFDAVDTNVVWAIGYDGAAAKRNYNFFTTTKNGGASFTAGTIFADTNSYVISNIEGIDSMNAWVAAYKKISSDRGVIYHTTNAGVSWADGGTVSMFSTAGESFADFVTFVTPTKGIAVGDPRLGEFEIYRTNNGGVSWTAISGSVIPDPLPAIGALHREYGLTDSYAKFGANDIWFGTNRGRVYHSNTGGLTWNVGVTGASDDIIYLAFRDALNGLVYGYTGATLVCYSTTNGGITWTALPFDPNMGASDICAIPGTTWYASVGAGLGNTLISYSYDDGLTWNNWGGSGIQYTKLDFVNSSKGWAGSFSSNVTLGIAGIYKYSGLPLAINSINLMPAEINMYPNPSNGEMIINLLTAKEGAIINVMDLMGKMVYSENVKTSTFEKHNLNLQHLAKGIYHVNIIRGTEKYSQKIAIQ